MKKVKEDEENEDMKRTLYIQELQDVVSNVADRWRRLKGMQEAQAVVRIQAHSLFFKVFYIVDGCRLITGILKTGGANFVLTECRSYLKF